MNLRLRFDLHFLYATGLQLVEAVSVRVDDLNWLAYGAAGDDDEAVEGWELTVIGKSRKARVLRRRQDMIGALSKYLVSRGLDADPGHAINRGAYLLGCATDLAERAPWSRPASLALDPKAALTMGTLARQLTAFFTGCTQVSEMTDTKSATRLAAASTRWLRHTHGSHVVATGMSLEVLQQNLGHASLNETTIYAASEKRGRMRQMQQFLEKRATR